MLDEVLSDVKSDFAMLERSGATKNSAMETLKAFVMKYVTTRKLGYADGVRMVSSILFLLVAHRKEIKNG